MTSKLALKNVLLPFGDVFPCGILGFTMQSKIRSLIYALIEDLLSRGAYGVYIDGGFGKTEIINAIVEHLPSELGAAINIIEPEKLIASEANSLHFVRINQSELLDKSIYGSDGLVGLTQFVQRWIYYFFVAREFKLAVPTSTEVGIEQISKLRDILKEGQTHARLSIMLSILKSYDRHDIATIDTDEYVWQYIQRMEPELCCHYVDEFTNLGISGQIDVAKKRLVQITNDLVRRLSDFQVVYRAIDLYEGSKIEKVLNLIPKNENYVPSYIGSIESIRKHEYNYFTESQRIMGMSK